MRQRDDAKDRLLSRADEGAEWPKMKQESVNHSGWTCGSLDKIAGLGAAAATLTNCHRVPVKFAQRIVRNWLSRSALMCQFVVFSSLLCSGIAWAARGYTDQQPACPYCAAEAIVLPTTTPLLFASIKWCCIAEAPCISDPTRVCQVAGDFKTMMWRRHERPSDCIWIPQCQITLRSGGIINVQQFKEFNDLDASAGNPGDIAILDGMGNPAARGISYQGSITRPWMAFADPTVLCQLSSVALEFGHAL